MMVVPEPITGVRCDRCASHVWPRADEQWGPGTRAHREAVGDRVRWNRALLDATSAGPSAPLLIARLCVESLGVSGAGVSTVSPSGTRSVLCATDATSALIEELQFTLGEGPCLDAVRDRAPVLISDLDEPMDFVVDRWPGLLDGLATTDVRALFAFPLCVGAIDLGALDLHRTRPGPLSPDDLAGALLAADSIVLALMRGVGRFENVWQEDPESRSTSFRQVHQATGMVQVQMGLSTDEAFLLVRARAFSTGRPVSDVAADIVERRIRFTPEDS